MKQKAFENRIAIIMAHNDYTSDMRDVDTCNKKDVWTPCDLVIREYLNNGGGSSKGFLGILPNECIKMYKYICEHKQELIAKNMISKDGINNFGFTLWKNYSFDR